MDVSIGNRLYQYRRKSGLSQEELAAKIGVSRQAVSKWERAEAAPDTDNLINLSKIYGVTLDELINTDPADSAARSSDSSDDEINTDDNSEKKNKVHIGFDGIHVDDGKDKVDISWHGGVHVNDGDTEVHVDKGNVHIVENGKVIKNKITKKLMVSRLPITLITVFIYLVLGLFFDLWHPGWIVFIMIPVLMSFISAIQNKNALRFFYPVLVCAVYLVLGCVWGLWHPWWIIFLTVPIYYGIVNAFR